MADRDRKGRTATGSRNGYYTRPDRRRPVPVYHGIGERNGRARLSREEVKELRERYASGGYTQRELAVEYAVSKSALNYALRGVTWS